MSRYKLLKPHYLGTRYYAEGSVVDYDGPPSKGGMIALDDKNRPVKDGGVTSAAAAKHAASEVPMEGGEPPDPTWAPQTRPAFSVKTLRKPNPNDPDDQASIVRVAASAPSASAPSGDPGDAPTTKSRDDRAKDEAYAKAQADERAAARGAAAHKVEVASAKRDK